MLNSQLLIIVTAIGFVSGFLISLQEIGLDYLINKVWMGWSITTKKFAFSTCSLSFLFGIGAYLLMTWEPLQSLNIPPVDIVPLFFKTGVLISIVTPISGQIRTALAQQGEPAEDVSGQK
ncbi:MAG: hypothetical protein AAFY72_12470 [Cyanobacteria bacterium J06649_4]